MLFSFPLKHDRNCTKRQREQVLLRPTYIPFRGASSASLGDALQLGSESCRECLFLCEQRWIPVRVLSLRKPALQAVPRPAACCGSLGEAGGKM